MTFLVNGDDPNLVVFPTHRLVHSLPSVRLRRGAREGASRSSRCSRRDDMAVGATRSSSGCKTAPVAAGVRRRRARRPRGAALAEEGRRPRRHTRRSARSTRRCARPTSRVLHPGVLEHILGISQEAQAKKTNIRYPQDAARRARGAPLGQGAGALPHERHARRAGARRRRGGRGDAAEVDLLLPEGARPGLAIHTLDPSRAVPTRRGRQARSP